MWNFLNKNQQKSGLDCVSNFIKKQKFIPQKNQFGYALTPNLYDWNSKIKGQKISTKTDFFSKTNLSLISTYELSKPKLITKSDYGNTEKLKLT